MSLPAIIGAIVLVLLVAIVVAINIANNSNKEKAKEFLQGLSDQIVAAALNIIEGFDPKKYKTVEEFETAILDVIYSNIYDYVTHEIANAEYTDVITKAIVSKLSKDMVISFIDQLIQDKNLYEIIEGEFAIPTIESGEMEKEDEALAKEFSNEEDYVENVDENPVDWDMELTEEEKEQIANLNPQIEDEKEYVPEEDDSIEYVEDEVKEVKPEIVKIINKAGKAMYYEVIDGKKHQITKAYAARFLSPDEL